MFFIILNHNFSKEYDLNIKVGETKKIGDMEIKFKDLKIEKRENYIPLGTFVRVDYPVGDFKNVFKLPETSLYTDKVYIVENGIAKPKKIKLIYKGSGYILVDGNLSENDYIITTRIPENLNNQKIKILN